MGIFFLFPFITQAQTIIPKKAELCQGYYQSEEAARHQLAEFTRSFKTLKDWDVRAARIREGILKGAGWN
jgi:hypothetical protein